MVYKPVLLYDGDCGFCRRWIKRWRNLTGDQVLYFTYQEKRRDYPSITEEVCKKSIQLIETDGHVYSGAEAVFRVLDRHPSRRWLLKLYKNLPGFAPVCEWFYGLVARNRIFFSRFS